MKGMRIIPVMMVTAALFMLAKFSDIATGTHALSQAMAEQSGSEAPPKPEAKKEEAKQGESKKEEPKKEEAENKAEGEKKEEHKEEHGENKASEKGKEENPAVSDTVGDVTGRHFSTVELDLLQNLSKRREDLSRWEKNIQIKEAALEATQKRIDEKIEQIESMKQAVSALLAKYNEKEDSKIRSLVKIYENMKPADAARIFDEMEMSILLLVIDKMSEKKAAPVLASMDSKRAKQVTVELAAQRTLSAQKLRAANPPAAATP